MIKIKPKGKGSTRRKLHDDFWGNVQKACKEVGKKKNSIFLLFEPMDINCLKKSLMQFSPKINVIKEPDEFVFGIIKDVVEKILAVLNYKYKFGVNIIVMPCDPSQQPNDNAFSDKGTSGNIVLWIRPLSAISKK